ncbi:MAG: MBL fold metallo-hydrolase [Eubacteriales bacterium]|nr:MBL fold metallo-hydrolase [Eubacteriales bacterium]
MDKQVKIIYYYNSGFSVQVGSTLLLFDYWEGEGRKLSESVRITPSFLKAFEQIFIFVSHGHPDHLDPIIYTWAKENLPITYIVSNDMPIGTVGKRMAPLQVKELTRDISVKAFQSTDLGVAFLVHAYGLNIFHAGDLNLWHWRQESTLREIEAAEDAFYEAMKPMKDEKIDVAMFPVDPRQGMMYDAGANHFIMTQKPRVFIPMHWQERPEIAIDFARRGKTPHTEILAMTKPGMVANMTFSDQVLDIHIIEPPKDMEDVPIQPIRKLDPYAKEPGEDPFTDTDLPVDIE